MIINVDFAVFQKALKDFKTLVSKSPLAKTGDDVKELNALLTADDSVPRITLEVAMKGFYLSTVIPGTITDPGSLMIRVDNVIGLKANLGECTLSCTEADKTLRIKSGRFKADIPISHSVNAMASQRPDKLVTTHSIHSSKMAAAISCVKLDGSKDDTLFARFVLNGAGLSTWSNSPSTAALYKNSKASFDEELSIVFPVDFLSTYLSKVTSKVQLATDGTVFQLTSDEIDISHPLRDADVFDINSSVDDILNGDDRDLTFGCSVDAALDTLNSVVSFAPDDSRMSLKIDSKKNTALCKTTSPIGDGENVFSVTEPEGKASKGVECTLNCKILLGILSSIKSLGVDDMIWHITSDRILLQSKDGMVNYICAQME